MIEKCAICDEFIFSSHHTCKPCFYVWREEDNFEEIIGYKSRYRVFASGTESAAEKFAESDWEFPDEARVYVISVEDGNEIFEKYLDEKEEWLTPEGEKILREKSDFYDLTSECVRNFYAHKAEKEK